MHYDGKKFRSVMNTENGEVSGDTVFYYRQESDLVWAEYSGGDIVKGFLVGTTDREGNLAFSYQHVNAAREIRMGRCESVPELLSDGRIRLRETWQWLNGDCSSGTSVIEEERA